MNTGQEMHPHASFHKFKEILALILSKRFRWSFSESALGHHLSETMSI